MLILHLLLFSIVGTSIFARDVEENTPPPPYTHQAATRPIQMPIRGIAVTMLVPDDETWNGYWSRGRDIPGFGSYSEQIILVQAGKVYHCTEPTMAGQEPAIRQPTVTIEIIGAPWHKWVSGLL